MNRQFLVLLQEPIGRGFVTPRVMTAFRSKMDDLMTLLVPDVSADPVREVNLIEWD